MLRRCLQNAPGMPLVCRPQPGRGSRRFSLVRPCLLPMNACNGFVLTSRRPWTAVWLALLHAMRMRPHTGCACRPSVLQCTACACCRLQGPGGVLSLHLAADTFLRKRLLFKGEPGVATGLCVFFSPCLGP